MYTSGENKSIIQRFYNGVSSAFPEFLNSFQIFVRYLKFLWIFKRSFICNGIVICAHNVPIFSCNPEEIPIKRDRFS